MNVARVARALRRRDELRRLRGPGAPPAAESIAESLRNPAGLGALPAFASLDSWTVWIIFIKAVYGIPLEPVELETFKRHTGRPAPREGGYPEAVAIVGVQSGKSQVAAAIAAYETERAHTERARGEAVLLVAQDERSVKRTLLRYAGEALEAMPALRAAVAGRTAHSITLASA